MGLTPSVIRPVRFGLRLSVGIAAALAALPYLSLKVMWVAGSRVGIEDPAFSWSTSFRVANVLTLGLDAVAVAVALALTVRWGERLPAWLVLVPMWVASGLLGTLVVVLALAAPLAGRGRPDPTGTEALANWVFVVVYTGFAVQGVLLLTAFVLYAMARWPLVFAEADAPVARPGRAPAPAVAVGVALAAMVGLILLLWAAGITPGTDGPDPQSAVDRAALGVYGAFCLAAGAGVLGLARPRHRRIVVPLALSWMGTASMATWGLHSLVVASANPSSTTAAMTLLDGIRVVVALWLAACAIRFTPRVGRRS